MKADKRDREWKERINIAAAVLSSSPWLIPPAWTAAKSWQAASGTNLEREQALSTLIANYSVHLNNLIRSHYSQMCLALRLPEIASATRSRSSGTQLCTSSAVDPAAKQISLNSARANFLTMSALSHIFTLANFPWWPAMLSLASTLYINYIKHTL